mgnify:CR=1 FL=1
MRFKEIQGYPNYLIYEDGRVWSKGGRRWKEGFLHPVVNKGGYSVINLSKEGKIKMFLIHRLVAINFIPNPENKPCVDHKDNIRTNNKLSNLRWVTVKENNMNSLKSKGVCYRTTEGKRKKRWEAYWRVEGKKKCKCFLTEEEALQHRKLMVKKYYSRPTST